jgi:hypothetical protein
LAIGRLRVLMVGISALVQLGTVWYLGSTISGGDAQTYLRLAQDWASWERLLSPEAFEGNFWPAGYSGFLALFGWAGEQQVVLVRCAQVAMAGAVALMAGAWVDRISARAGTVTVAIVAFSPTMLFAVWSIGYELLLAFLLTLGLSLLWRAAMQSSHILGLTAGAVLGLALLVQFRVVLAVLAIILMLRRLNVKVFWFGLLGILLPMTAWAMRSFTATGNPAPWSANGPYNMWNGNNPLATGRNLFPLPELPVGADSYSAAAIDWIVENPVSFLVVTGKKFAYLFDPTRIAGISDAFPGEVLVSAVEFGLAGFIVVMLVMFLALRISARASVPRVLDLLFVVSMSYLLPNIFFIVESRFAIPVHAMLVGLAVGTSVLLMRLIDQRARLSPGGRIQT